jgi:branched-chain amino acid transport system permease protein
VRRVAAGAALGLLAAVPLLVSSNVADMLTRVLAFALLALGLDLLAGIGGLPSLGQAAPFGVGAYAAALLAKHVTTVAPLQLLAATAAGAALSAAVGWLLVRSRGTYFLMLTLAVGEIVHELADRWEGVTGGTNGLAGIPAITVVPGAAPVRLAGVRYWYVLTAVLVCGAALVMVSRSAFGRTLRGVRDNEERMRSLGYRTFLPKYAVFCIAGAAAGAAGALWVAQARFVSPADLGFEVSAMALLAVVIGGRGSLWGAALGAAVVVLVREELSPQLGGRGPLVLGLVFVAAVYLLPRGFAGTRLRWPSSPGDHPGSPPDPPSYRGTTPAVPRTPPSHRGTTPAVPPDPPRAARDGSDVTALLETTGLTRRYGSLVALDGVSLSVAAGARHAVIGPNGAGKSTLFALVTGTLRPTAGRVVFDGQDVTRRPDHARARAGMGKTFQHSSLFTSLPVLDNLALATQRAAGRGMAMLRPAGRQVAVQEQAMRLLEQVGLSGRAGTPAAALSHGERRQLEVALALATSPKLLLLDEPTAGMSAADSSRFAELVESLGSAVTVLIIEHDLDVVFRLATRVTVLHLGRVLADGSPDEIRADETVQRAYLGDAALDDLFFEAAP